MDFLEAHTVPADQVRVVYFGPAWRSRVLARGRRVTTPLGEKCRMCDEPIIDGERGLIAAAVELDSNEEPKAVIAPLHAECQAYPMIGHMVEVCPCHGHEPTRDAARLAWQRAQLGDF